MSSKVKRKPFAHYAANLGSQKSGEMFSLSLQEHWLVRHRALPRVSMEFANTYKHKHFSTVSSAANSMDTAQSLRSHTSKPLPSPSSMVTQPCVNPISTWRYFWILRLNQWHFNKI